MTTPTLTDRYVWAVLQCVPSRQRADLESELRALVADAIDASAGDERAALTELGDPNALGARYSDSPQYLIGPALFGPWRALVTRLLVILVPILSAVVLTSSLVSGSSISDAILDAAGTAWMVAIQLVFWFTLVVAIMDRTVGHPSGRSTAEGRAWSPNELPDLPDDGRMGVAELVFTVFFNVLVLAALVWVQWQPLIAIDGEAFALFDPALWSFWMPWFIAVLISEVLLTVARFLRGRWTWPLANVNATLGAAFALPVLYLWQNDLLLNPELVTKVSASAGSTWIGVTGTITAIVIVVIVAIDAIDGFRKARQATITSAGV